MTNQEKIEALRERLDAEWELQGKTASAVSTMRHTLSELSSCLDQVGEKGNPDEYTRGMCAAYNDVVTRLANLEDDIEAWGEEIFIEVPE